MSISDEYDIVISYKVGPINFTNPVIALLLYRKDRECLSAYR